MVQTLEGATTSLVVNAKFLSQPITGVQRYAIAIAYEIKRSMGSKVLFVCPKSILHKKVAIDLGAQVVGFFGGYFWEQFELPLFLNRNGNPLLLNLANTAPLFYDNKICTICDVSFEIFPESFSWKFVIAYKYMIPRLVKSSKKVITISEFSRKEICRTYDLPYEKVSVVGCAVSEDFYPVSKISGAKYILTVSSLNRQKNLHSLVEAFKTLEDSDLKLYIIGSHYKSFSKKNNLSEIPSNSDRIVFLGRVDDKILRHYYSNALFFVFPSLYEGFGIPPLEAQACGCPCIVSNTASLPEIYNDSVIYFDPNSIHDIARKISLLLSREELRIELIEKGFYNVKKFSWEESGSRLLELVEKL